MTLTCPIHGEPLRAVTYTHPGTWRYEYSCGCYRMRSAKVEHLKARRKRAA